MNSAARKRRPARPFFYLDLNDTVRRVALFTAVVREKLPTLASLKHDYALAMSQVSDARLNTTGETRVVSGGPILGIARAKGLVDDSVHPSSYSLESRSAAIRQVQHSLLFLRLQHPPLHRLCDLLITDIVCWPSVRLRGGSTERLPGIVWLAPSGNLTSIEIAEFLIHEMVHMNLHLADMTLGLFTRAPGSYFTAHSALLGRRRPYYHAYHSACVAVAMLYFRRLLGLHKEMDWLGPSLQRCTSELLDHRAAFTGLGWHALLAAHEFSRAPRLSVIPAHRNLTRLA